MFQGLGRLKDSYSIQIDDSIRRVVHAPRCVPDRMRSTVHEELEQLANERVITPITDATYWVSSMVVVQKPSGQIWLCRDPKDIHVAMRHEYYPMPSKKSAPGWIKKKVFTVLDATNDFWQIALVDRSSMLTCFKAPFGLYRWMRMPFGINSASAVQYNTIQ